VTSSILTKPLNNLVMYITKIYCNHKAVLCNVIWLLPELVSSFTCYTEERVVICNDERQSLPLLTKNLRDCGVDMDEVYLSIVYNPKQQ